MEFTDALSELYREDMFPLRNVDIKDELDNIRVRAGFHSMKENVGSSSQFCYIRMILNSSNHFVNPSILITILFLCCPVRHLRGLH